MKKALDMSIFKLPMIAWALIFLAACNMANCPIQSNCDPNLPPLQIRSCPQVTINPSGNPSDYCGSQSECKTGNTCVLSNCLPAGSLNEACDDSPTVAAGTCDPGLTCAFNDNIDWYTCQSCGQTAGGACCPGNICGNGFMCQAGTCVQPSTPDAHGCGGPNTYWAWVSTDQCAAIGPNSVTSDTLAHAQQCANWLLPMQIPSTWEAGAVGPTPTSNPPFFTPSCGTNCDIHIGSEYAGGTTTLAWFTSAHEHQCQQNLDHTCTWTDAACP